MTPPICDVCALDEAKIFARITQGSNVRKGHLCEDCFEIMQKLCLKFPGLAVQEISQQDFNALMDPMYEPG